MLTRMTGTDFKSFDGVRLSYRTEGEGRPVLMLHGFLANSHFNFVEPGITQAIVDAGFRTIMLDHRGHGLSDAPTDVSAYPPDVLALDAETLLRELNITDYDIVGYSLGARTAMRMLVRGAKPRRAVIGGMGDSGVIGLQARVAFFEDAIIKGEAGAFPQAAKAVRGLMERSGAKPEAMLPVLRSQSPTPKEAIQAIDTSMLVISGAEDNDNGSAEALAALMPSAIATRTPGNHLSAVNAPEFTRAIVDFLRA